MSLVSVSALSSWVSCPRQFFAQYVCKEEVKLNAAMTLGSIKHKVHELASDRDEQIVKSLKAGQDVLAELERIYGVFAREAVMTYASSLRMVNLPAADAFHKTLPVAKQSAKHKADILAPLIAKGLFGEDLWSAIIPKVKSEYSVQSKKLGIKGRIDQLELYGSRLLPVELKSGMCPSDGVFEHHRIQAASYALMLEDIFGTSVPEAIVHYVDHGHRRSVMMNPFVTEWVSEVAGKVKDTLASQSIPKGGCKKEYCEACKAEDAALLARIPIKKPAKF